MNNEIWTVRELVPGDMIRVYTGRFYHLGIYIGDEKVIHFAGPDAHHLTDAASARIRIGSLDEFAMNGQIEVRSYTLRERFKKRSRRKVIAEAVRHVGEDGYDIIYNNCEHFANRCVFGVAFSTQIDEMRKLIEQGA